MLILPRSIFFHMFLPTSTNAGGTDLSTSVLAERTTLMSPSHNGSVVRLLGVLTCRRSINSDGQNFLGFGSCTTGGQILDDHPNTSQL